MSREFDRVYADGGRSSIPPERLVRALTLQILYSIRSERLLCEQLDYNLLFRWFVGMTVDEAVWDHSSFTKNRERLIQAKVARKLLRRVVRNAKAARLLSNEHFRVDGTLIESWAVKSMRRRDGKDEPPGPGRNREVNFHGEKRTNETHVSPTDPEAKLYRKSKGQAAKLSYMAHVLMDHRHGLPVDVEITSATGFAEREAALTMLDRLPKRTAQRTVAGDKGYDTADFVHGCRERGITPHVACNDNRPGGSALDGRTTRHNGYQLSQRVRKRIEEGFGWSKDGRPLRKMKLTGPNRCKHAVNHVGRCEGEMIR